jgi:hypothetical protein
MSSGDVSWSKCHNNSLREEGAPFWFSLPRLFLYQDEQTAVVTAPRGSVVACSCAASSTTGGVMADEFGHVNFPRAAGGSTADHHIGECKI